MPACFREIQPPLDESAYWRNVLSFYPNDAATRDAGMTAEERLRFHQQHSKPILEALHDWLEAQFAERKVEPNSSLGKAITICSGTGSR